MSYCFDVDEIQLKCGELAKSHLNEIFVLKDFIHELPQGINFNEILYNNEVSILLKSEQYLCPVYVAVINIMYNERKIGYYKYVVNLDYEFIDEFFVL